MDNGQSATNNGAPENFNIDLSGDTVVDDFLKKLLPADAENDQPSGSKEKKADEPPAKEDKAAAEKTEEDDNSAEKPEDKSEDESSEEKTEDEADKEDDHKYAEDGTYVKIKVGDEEHEVPVKDLQRLYGQEAALTKKSMEVAEQRKAVDAEMARNVAATSALLERAKARYAPYAQVDFLLAAKNLSAEDYTNLRQAAQSAYEDVQFLENGVNQVMQAAQQRQNESLVARATEALKVLGGPVEQGGIEGFNEEKYEDIRNFGISQGLDRTVIDNLVDPVAIKILHNAMLYERGKSKVITKVVNKTPKKVIKTTRAPEAGNPGDKTKENRALSRLQKTGSTDDAADAFLARWESNAE